MKNLYITLSFMLATTALMAQSKDTQAADKLYARYEYVDAAQEYLKIDKKDPYVYKQLADSYYNMFNSKEAVKWYAKATETPQDAETYYKYAQMLKAEGKYEDANKQMSKFASMAPNDHRAKTFLQDPNYLPKLRNQAKLFDEKVLDINDKKYGSFGGVLGDDGTFYFTSSRNTARKTYGATEEPYLDLYQATYNANGTFSEPTPVSDINSKWHDGPAVVSADGNTMYFASESFKESKQFERDKENNLKVGQVYLFRATKQNGKWGDAQPLPFNDKKWSTGNPSISKDGKTLYFASDREGGIGGNDIWKVAINGNNSYGEPVNLGPSVNTEGKESFPYITDDNKLYFSSDGRKGFGSLDVFVIDLKKGTDAMNVGMPVNSGKDDFAFTFNTTKNIGFFSSNREGVDKLYSATPVCGVEAIVMVKDAKTGQPLATAKVAILDEKNNVIETRTTGADGKVTYNVDCDRAYTVQAIADGYEGNSFPVAKTKGGEVNVAADLNPIQEIVKPTEIVLNEIFFEYNKSNITKEAAFELNKAVEAMKANPNMVVMVKAHTDSRGTDQYNMSLSNRRAKSTVQYIISKGIAKARISGQGYGESEPKVKCTTCTEEEHAQNRRSEFLIVKQ
ncbi:OmpA family protein [Flavobacterium zepuense]|uniref:OmpA family protein n=1 Tax=Flavobacterium zepuense TaxID=2593302 RepID=A0A552US19_9FLAO|nr:OmpA family protein [Flavobacterium zepuense]TRW21021.1 OmpA family protein [Flavobacterium zepuense]